ncbi:hypothetical protein [Cytobacillus firmus]|uniref:hypothetical protein n=2 Tax=Cytobacillus TaxID=2675230 RepID=UPI00203A6DFC|nr:hypothetical protein [Cytobacillus firmus]
MIKKLLGDKNFEMIAEIYDGDRQLIAGLFQKKEVSIMSKFENLRSKHENLRRKKVSGGHGWSKRMMKKLEMLKEAGADEEVQNRDFQKGSIGVERLAGEEVDFIGSYHLRVEEFSRRATVRFVLDKVCAQLSDGEKAFLKIADYTLLSKTSWFSHYKNLQIEICGKRKLKGANLLALDAISRQEHVEEEMK